MSDVLVVSDLLVSYGAVAALRGVSLHVGVGEAVAVVGPNGSGKTTLLRISGLVKPKRRDGSTRRGGRVRPPTVPDRPAGAGARAEGRLALGSLTVMENLLLGAPPP